MPTSPQLPAASSRRAPVRVQTESPPMRAVGEVVDELAPLYKSGNSTRAAYPPEISQVGLQSGYAQTFVAGSGSGPSDRMYYTPLPVPFSSVTPFGSGLPSTSTAPNQGWFGITVIGHKRVRHPQAATLDEHTLAAQEEWLRSKLVEAKGNLGELTGVSGMSIDARQRFAKDMTILNDYTAAGADVVQDGPNGPARLIFPRLGHERIEVLFACGVPTGESGSAATSMNGLSCAF